MDLEKPHPRTILDNRDHDATTINYVFNKAGLGGGVMTMVEGCASKILLARILLLLTNEG